MLALYPGSFNPWHVGHEDVLLKALKVFDKVVVGQGINPAKGKYKTINFGEDLKEKYMRVDAQAYEGLTADFAKKIGANAIIRGLRNASDLKDEMEFQYWSEDLGLTIPVFYILCDKKYIHISSSIIRGLK